MWQLVWYIALTVVGELLRPKPKNAPTAAIGDFQFPTAEDGRPIPIIAGTVKVKGANVVWYGDLRKDSIKQKTSFLGGSTKVGAQYYLGFQAALCLGQAGLVSMEWGDKPIPYTVTNLGDRFRLTFNEPGLFGGKKSEGGIAGEMDFYPGSLSQSQNDYLAAQFGGGSIPAYRGVAMAVARQMYLGTTAYVKSPAFIMRHTPNTLGLTSNRHIIDGRAANPAAFIYWLLTDPMVGVGYPVTQIDVDVFRSVGNALHAEGSGVNLQWDSIGLVGELVDEVLRHVDGFRYIDPVTGLFCIGLIRDDYDPASLPEFDMSNIAEVEVREPSWGDQVNYVTLEYMDVDFKKRAVPYPNLAAIERSGEVNARTVQYLGIHDPDQALAMAARLAKRYAYPLKSGRFKVDRTAWNLHEGSVFMWSGYPFDIPARVMRVIDIDYGTLEEGYISLEAAEDIFGVARIAYQAPSSSWVDTIAPIAPLLAQRVLEVPYQINGASEDVRIWAVGVRSGAGDQGMEIYTDRGNTGLAWVLTNDVEAFAPSGVLSAAWDDPPGMDSGALTLVSPVDLAPLEDPTADEFERGRSVMLIDNELIGWRWKIANPDGSFTFAGLARGLFDTVPVPHSAGARAYLISEALTLADESPIVPDQSVGVAMLPYNGSFALALGDHSPIAITTSSRAARPYPPGRFLVDGVYAPGTIVGNVAITWSHRNRITQAAEDRIVPQEVAGSYSAEGDVQLQFWILGVLRRTENVSGTSFTYTTAMRTADYGADTTEPVQVRAYGRNPSLVLSAQFQARTFVQIV